MILDLPLFLSYMYMSYLLFVLSFFENDAVYCINKMISMMSELAETKKKTVNSIYQKSTTNLILMFQYVGILNIMVIVIRNGIDNLGSNPRQSGWWKLEYLSPLSHYMENSRKDWIL